MPMSYKEAVAYAKKLDVKLVPYENEDGMAGTKAAMEQIKKGESAASSLPGSDFSLTVLLRSLRSPASASPLILPFCHLTLPHSFSWQPV